MMAGSTRLSSASVLDDISRLRSSSVGSYLFQLLPFDLDPLTPTHIIPHLLLTPASSGIRTMKRSRNICADAEYLFRIYTEHDADSINLVSDLPMRLTTPR